MGGQDQKVLGEVLKKIDAIEKKAEVKDPNKLVKFYKDNWKKFAEEFLREGRVDNKSPFEKKDVEGATGKDLKDFYIYVKTKRCVDEYIRKLLKDRKRDRSQYLYAIQILENRYMRPYEQSRNYSFSSHSRQNIPINTSNKRMSEKQEEKMPLVDSEGGYYPQDDDESGRPYRSPPNNSKISNAQQSNVVIHELSHAPKAGTPTGDALLKKEVEDLKKENKRLKEENKKLKKEKKEENKASHSRQNIPIDANNKRMSEKQKEKMPLVNSEGGYFSQDDDESCRPCRSPQNNSKIPNAQQTNVVIHELSHAPKAGRPTGDSVKGNSSDESRKDDEKEKKDPIPEVALLKKEVEDLKKKNENIQNSLKHLKDENKRLKEENNKLKKEKEEENIKRLDEEKELKKENEILRNDIEVVKKEMEAMATDQDGLKNKIDVVVKENEKQKKLLKQLDDQKEVIKKQKATNVAIEKKHEQLQKDIESILEENEKHKTEYKKLERECEDLKKPKRKTITISTLNGTGDFKKSDENVLKQVKGKLEDQYVDLEVIPWDLAQQQNTGRKKILLVFCINTSRLGTDVDAVVAKIRSTEKIKMILVIFHHKPQHNTKTVPSKDVLPKETLERARASTVVDCVYWSNAGGFYKCEMNDLAVQELTDEFEDLSR